MHIFMTVPYFLIFPLFPPISSFDLNPDEIAEMNRIAERLAAEMRYQQLKHEMVNYHLE